MPQVRFPVRIALSGDEFEQFETPEAVELNIEFVDDEINVDLDDTYEAVDSDGRLLRLVVFGLLMSVCEPVTRPHYKLTRKISRASRNGRNGFAECLDGKKDVSRFWADGVCLPREWNEPVDGVEISTDRNAPLSPSEFHKRWMRERHQGYPA